MKQLLYTPPLSIADAAVLLGQLASILECKIDQVDGRCNRLAEWLESKHLPHARFVREVGLILALKDVCDHKLYQHITTVCEQDTTTRLYYRRLLTIALFAPLRLDGPMVPYLVPGDTLTINVDFSWN